MRAPELRQRWLDLAGERTDDPAGLWRDFLELTALRATGCEPARDGDLLLFEAGRHGTGSGDVASVQRQLFEEEGGGGDAGMTTFGFTVPVAEPAAEKQWGNAASPEPFRDAVEATAAFRAIRDGANASIWWT